MNYTIETNELTQKFDAKTAVNALNLKVPGGSIFAFLGPNGAGKTTTIKALMNIITPTRGTATVLGVDSQKLGPQEFRQIGYVSENQEMPEWMRVGDFLNYCRKMYPAWDSVFCQELVAQFELPLKEKIKNISRGMKMKTALVSSLVYRPKLVMLDEPFSGLDPLVRQDFIDGILKITESQNWTIFISSHDLDEVERLADWVGMIDQGNLKIQEETDTLLTRFRKVEVPLSSPITEELILPESWLLPEYSERSLHFIESCYQEGRTEAQITREFPGSRNATVTTLSLKEIFIALAKHYKLGHF